MNPVDEALKWSLTKALFFGILALIFSWAAELLLWWELLFKLEAKLFDGTHPDKVKKIDPTIYYFNSAVCWN